METFQKVQENGVCATKSGALGNARSHVVEKIIHVKSPKYLTQDKVTNRVNMEATILNILDAALIIEAETLFIPALSVKIHDFPCEEVAEIMLYWIIEWCHLPNTGKIRQIKIVNSDPHISEVFKTTLYHIE